MIRFFHFWKGVVAVVELVVGGVVVDDVAVDEVVAVEVDGKEVGLMMVMYCDKVVEEEQRTVVAVDVVVVDGPLPQLNVSFYPLLFCFG
jgi:hypothetical protein